MSTPQVNVGLLAAATPPPDVERAVRRALLIAALLCAAVVVALVAVHELTRHDDPLKSPQLAALKAQLLAEPQNEALKEQIRALDLKLRQRHAWLLAVYRDGAWILAGAAVALVLLGKLWTRWHTELPRPRPRPDAAERYARATQLARRLAAGVGALALVALGWLSLSARSPVPADPAELEKWLARLQGGATGETAAAADLPAPAEYSANWPRFLGPTGNPRATHLALALKFDLATGAGLRWKTPLAAAGFNSPLIWSNRVFLSGGDASVRRVFAFDLATGQLAWERAVTNVPGSPAVPPEVPESTGFAASTMATDGRRVYALFANGDLAAFTLEGAPVWAKNLGTPQNPYGHATSLVTWRDRLLVQYDQAEPEKNLSRLYAFEGVTGRVLWQKNRRVTAERQTGN